MKIVAIPMDGTKYEYRLADALQAVQALMDLPYDGTGVVPPNRSAAVRAKSLIMAIGPFTAGGPQRITLTASIKGGLTVTFFAGGTHAVVACMNNGRTLLIEASATPQAEDLPLEEAIERTRAVVVGCGHEQAEPLRPHAAAY